MFVKILVNTEVGKATEVLRQLKEIVPDIRARIIGGPFDIIVEEELPPEIHPIEVRKHHVVRAFLELPFVQHILFRIFSTKYGDHIAEVEIHIKGPNTTHS